MIGILAPRAGQALQRRSDLPADDCYDGLLPGRFYEITRSDPSRVYHRDPQWASAKVFFCKTDKYRSIKQKLQIISAVIQPCAAANSAKCRDHMNFCRKNSSFRLKIDLLARGNSAKLAAAHAFLQNSQKIRPKNGLKSVWFSAKSGSWMYFCRT